MTLEELAEHVVDVSGLMTFHSQERGERGLARKRTCRNWLRPVDNSPVIWCSPLKTASLRSVCCRSFSIR